MTIKEASAIVGHSQGLPASFDGSTAAINELPTDAKLALTAGVLAYIRRWPDQFTPQQVAVANSDTTRQGNYGGGLTSAGFDLGEFVEEVGSNANRVLVRPLVNLGNNVGAAAGFLGTVVPWLLAAGVIYVLVTKTRGAAAA